MLRYDYFEKEAHYIMYILIGISLLSLQCSNNTTDCTIIAWDVVVTASLARLLQSISHICHVEAINPFLSF
jgi:hypothetical protein